MVSIPSPRGREVGHRRAPAVYGVSQTRLPVSRAYGQVTESARVVQSNSLFVRLGICVPRGARQEYSDGLRFDLSAPALRDRNVHP